MIAAPAGPGGPCPKCGAALALRVREGKPQVQCAGAGCRFGFDADRRGRPAARCPACGEGRLKTTPQGRVCADCGQWDNSPEGRAGGLCPKCQHGRLSIIKGEYGHFAGCSDLACGLTYTCDPAGRPEGGRCRLCRGPVRKTRSGARICVVCETWQEPKAPAVAATRPAEAACPGCARPLRRVLTRRRQWLYRCDGCQRWLREFPAAPAAEEAADP